MPKVPPPGIHFRAFPGAEQPAGRAADARPPLAPENEKVLLVNDK